MRYYDTMIYLLTAIG